MPRYLVPPALFEMLESNLPEITSSLPSRFRSNPESCALALKLRLAPALLVPQRSESSQLPAFSGTRTAGTSVDSLLPVAGSKNTKMSLTLPTTLTNSSAGTVTEYGSSPALLVMVRLPLSSICS